MVVRRLIAVLVAAATVATALALHPPTAARQSVRAAAAAPSGVEVEFARLMVLHHAQAVRMSRSVAARPQVSERIRLIAEFIAHDQQREIDATNAWLVAWGRSAVDPDDPATRRGHAGHGMLTEAALRRLDSATGADIGPEFLRDMIAHHCGAVAMSRSLLATGRGNAYTRGLARHAINEQTAENDAMRALLPGDHTNTTCR